MKLPPFGRAVTLTKYYEQWHTRYPYIGYGHRIQPYDKLKYPISEHQADSILRSYLRKNCAMFRKHKADSFWVASAIIADVRHCLAIKRSQRALC
jgi:lysozyme